MLKDREEFEHLLELLVKIMTRIESVHMVPRDFGTGVALHRAEIHTIQTIGMNPQITVTELARRMGVTKGAISQTLNKLVDKRLLHKKHVGLDGRTTALELTETGWRGFRSHERFHEEVFDKVSEYFGRTLKSKLDAIVALVGDLNQALEAWEQRKAGVRPISK
jgi:DNA-binding MarR family transcriptional regulator